MIFPTRRSVLATSLAIACVSEISCGGKAGSTTDVAERTDSGGTDGSGGAETGGAGDSGGSEATGGSGGELHAGGGSGGEVTGSGGETVFETSCDEEAEQARLGFTEEWSGHLSCQVDEDCVYVPGGSCFQPCFTLSSATAPPVQPALDEACATFEQAGCEARMIPCLNFTRPACLDGTCGHVAVQE